MRDGALLEFVIGDVVQLAVAVELKAFVAGKTDFAKLILIPAGSRIVMAEDPRARFGRAVEELREKTNAIELGLGGDGPVGGFHDRGQEIGGIHQIVVEARPDASGPTHDQRHVRAGIGGAALAADHRAASGL